MSAFVVSDTHMNIVVSGLLKSTWRTWSGTLIKGTIMGKWHAQKLGQRLFELNTLAVDGRYHEENPIPLYVHKDLDSTPIQLHKLLVSLIYQCSEEPAIKDPLYDDLCKVAALLADGIVSSLPGWDDAKWAV